MENRADKAKEYFMSGCNCAQAVLLAFADKYNLDNDTALRISASFGGGMGRSREVCGALSGALMVTGLETATLDLTDTQAKAANYQAAREVMEAFRTANGSIYCRELLGLSKQEESPVPSARTEAYYKKRPCPEIVWEAAHILEEKFAEK